MRTARSCTSGENFVGLLMTPSSQRMEPPTNPARFRPSAKNSETWPTQGQRHANTSEPALGEVRTGRLAERWTGCDCQTRNGDEATKVKSPGPGGAPQTKAASSLGRGREFHGRGARGESSQQATPRRERTYPFSCWPPWHCAPTNHAQAHPASDTAAQQVPGTWGVSTTVQSRLPAAKSP